MRWIKMPFRMFYGWWIVAASVIIGMYTAGLVFFGFTAIFEPIAKEFDWSYTQISLAASLRGLEIGLVTPLAGLLADRWGPRKLIAGGVFVTAMGLVLLSLTTSLAMFYIAFSLLAIGMSGCSLTVLMTGVVNWFRRRVGIATAIAASGYGAGGLMILLLVKLIDVYEWRTAMVILAVGMLALGLPLSRLFRGRPEEYGYSLDGETPMTAAFDNGLVKVRADEDEIGAKTALRSRLFWHVALAYVLLAMIGAAVITHVMPYLSTIGSTRATATKVAMAIPLISITGRLSFGWLGDKLDRTKIAVACYALVALGLVSFEYVSIPGSWPLLFFLILFSIGLGGVSALRPALVRQLFGRSSFGTILGLIAAMIAIGATSGAAWPGWVFDNWGSYKGTWLALSVVAVVALLSMMTIPTARRRSPTP